MHAANKDGNIYGSDAGKLRKHLENKGESSRLTSSFVVGVVLYHVAL